MYVCNFPLYCPPSCPLPAVRGSVPDHRGLPSGRGDHLQVRRQDTGCRRHLCPGDEPRQLPGALRGKGCVQVCVCIQVHAVFLLYTFKHIHMHMYVYTCTCISGRLCSEYTCTCMFIRSILSCAYTCVHVHVYTLYMCVHVWTCMFIFNI